MLPSSPQNFPSQLQDRQGIIQGSRKRTQNLFPPIEAKPLHTPKAPRDSPKNISESPSKSSKMPQRCRSSSFLASSLQLALAGCVKHKESNAPRSGGMSTNFQQKSASLLVRTLELSSPLLHPPMGFQSCHRKYLTVSSLALDFP